MPNRVHINLEGVFSCDVDKLYNLNLNHYCCFPATYVAAVILALS